MWLVVEVQAEVHGSLVDHVPVDAVLQVVEVGVEHHLGGEVGAPGAALFCQRLLLLLLNQLLKD